MEQTDKIAEWNEFFETTVRDEVTRALFIKYVEALLNKNLPVIFEMRHLSSLLGITAKTLAGIINTPSSFYRKFEIPKRSTGVREISSPYPVLLFAQRWIYENILKTVPTHDCACGFIEGKSIVGNAKPHLNCHCLLKMDIKDFFPSINLRRIQSIFNELGYSNTVSYDLASICCLDGCLPQGGATSPSLSNIVAFRMDKKLSLLARRWGLSYTRYADDMTFSGDYIPVHFIGIVSNVVEEEKFEVNAGKTKLIRGRNKQKIVTGISVAGEKLALPKKTKRELRKETHYLLMNGLFVHSANMRISDPIYTERLVGRLEFWRQIEPDNEFVVKSLKELRAYGIQLDGTLTGGQS